MGKLDVETRGNNLGPNRVVNARIKANKCANDLPWELDCDEFWCISRWKIYQFSRGWGWDTRTRKCWNGSQQRALRRSLFHLLENESAKEIENSHFREPDLWGCKHPWQGRGRGVPDFHYRDCHHSAGLRNYMLLVSTCSAALLSFCAFSHLMVQHIFIATYHLPRYFLSALYRAKKRHSHWHCRISMLSSRRQTINIYINKCIKSDSYQCYEVF